MVEFLTASENWRCKKGIYQRCQITWQTWDFSLLLNAWSLHPWSDGGDEGEIFELLAHCKIIFLETTFPTVHLCPILPATLAALWPPCSASPTSQPSLASPLPRTETTLTAFLPAWGCWNSLSSLCRDLLVFLSPGQVCGRCLVWVLNTFHLSYDDGVLKCCNLC